MEHQNNYKLRQMKPASLAHQNIVLLIYLVIALVTSPARIWNKLFPSANPTALKQQITRLQPCYWFPGLTG